MPFSKVKCPYFLMDSFTSFSIQKVFSEAFTGNPSEGGKQLLKVKNTVAQRGQVILPKF